MFREDRRPEAGCLSSHNDTTQSHSIPLRPARRRRRRSHALLRPHCTAHCCQQGGQWPKAMGGRIGLAQTTDLETRRSCWDAHAQTREETTGSARKAGEQGAVCPPARRQPGGGPKMLSDAAATHRRALPLPHASRQSFPVAYTPA